MSRLSAIVLIAVFTLYLININGVESAKCLQHGDACNNDSQCCFGTKCHRFAKKCQVQINPEELKNPQLKHNP
ncbi:unnamed protein product [Arctia plantaginis]|uniref:Uncharacterized protein n=1 Tax=Arctia plantaginis TaxID=874455 RepID=A0A8S0Z3A6_ARCPL|nr:unnamed protein product [Arctia plantaginis]